MNTRKIDVHSHIGTDRFHPHVGNLVEYCKGAIEKGVVRSYLMPVPCPRYQRDGGYLSPSFGEVNGTSVEFHSEFEKNGTVTRTAVGDNPFAEYNRMIAKQITDISSSGEFAALKLEFIPHCHPLRDTPEHVEATCAQNPPAIKIHGTSWGIDPMTIPPTFFEIVCRYEILLMLHTDYHSDPHNRLDMIKRANDPLVWIRLCEKYGLRAILAHGARLCIESLSIVNSSDSFMVGLSPTLYMEGYRVKSKGGRYLDLLCEMVDADKLLFDIDYPWNVTEDYKALTWDVDHELQALLSEGDLEKVYFTNAATFFGVALR